MNPARQIRQRLDSLRAAGVEFLPRLPAPEFEPVPDPTAAGRVALVVLGAEVAGCAKCPEMYSTRSQPVFGGGPMNPVVLFLGAAPEAEDDQTGNAFAGPAGELFAKMLAAGGFDRDEVYLTHAVKCRPPNDRFPAAAEIANCRGYLERQIAAAAPGVICCLGGLAADALLGQGLDIMNLRGRFHDYRGVPVLCTLHPLYLLRTPGAKRHAWDDIKLLVGRLGRSLPR